MSRILASIALAAAFVAPALASDAKTEFGNVQLQNQNLFKPADAKAALTTPTEQKTMTYSGGDLFATSVTDATPNTSIDLKISSPDAGSSFAAGEAAKQTLIKASQ
ncbi:MAG: hypothetical protein QM698_12040 [Micropepsaceae bacterium]